MKIAINPKNKLFRWGPIDGRPVYPLHWCVGMINFTKRFVPGWEYFLVYFNRESFLCLADFDNLYGKGEEVFKKYVMPDSEFRKNYKEWEGVIEKFNRIKREIESENFKDKNEKEFALLFKKWKKIYADEFWDIGSLPEVANWGGERMLERELRKKIKNEEKFHQAMERLTAPEDFSFYQKEEFDLLSLKEAAGKEKLKNHQKKYYWLLNNYHDTKILSSEYFLNSLKKISKKEAGNRLKEITVQVRKAKHDKIKIIKKFNLPKKVLKIARRLSFCIWWQDNRKSYIFQANHIIDIFLKEISRRKKVDFSDLHFYIVQDIERLVYKNIALAKKEIKNRKENFISINRPPLSALFYSGSKARSLMKPYLTEKVDKNLNELKGLVVNRGRVNGSIRILKSSKDFKKMKKGEILVAAMTSPEYIIALRKAAAVITDEGGMTCHAAIVARELGIPGIVATRVATKVLCDGQIVEVDANQGVIKILNKD